MEHRCAGKLSGGFGGPFMYVLSPTSTKPKYRLIKMEKKKKKKKTFINTPSNKLKVLPLQQTQSAGQFCEVNDPLLVPRHQGQHGQGGGGFCSLPSLTA